MKHKIPDPDLVIYPHTEVDELKARLENLLRKEARFNRANGQIAA